MEKIKEYLYGKPIFIMINVLGGILFLFYFMHIDFMPTLHIQDMLHLVFTMAIVGLFMALFLVILLIMPVLAWKHIFEKALSDIIETSTKKVGKDNSNKEKIQLEIYLALIYL